MVAGFERFFRGRFSVHVLKFAENGYFGCFFKWFGMFLVVFEIILIFERFLQKITREFGKPDSDQHWQITNQFPDLT